VIDVNDDDESIFRRIVVFEDANTRLRSENERLARELEAGPDVQSPNPVPSAQYDSTAIAFVATVVLAICAYIIRFCH
jgi:hypothetical protein